MREGPVEAGATTSARDWTPWLFAEVVFPLLPVGFAIAAALIGTKAVNWIDDVWWGNELPFTAIALCLPSAFAAKERLKLAKAGGWKPSEREKGWLTYYGLWGLCGVQLFMLAALYGDKFKVWGMTIPTASLAKPGFCLWALVAIILGLTAKAVTRKD